MRTIVDAVLNTMWINSQFIYPLSARELRLVARRNAFRTSHTTLTRTWLPEHVYPPPPPPHPRINVGYVSSDFM